MRTLLIEDDDPLADGMAEALQRHGFSVDRLASADGAEAALSTVQYDLLLLDIGLPGADGFDLLRRLRDRSLDLPVLMVTARDAVEDRVHGLRLGADDYLVKPFAIDELLARCDALLRRSRTSTAQQIAIGSLVLDTGRQSAQLGDQPLELTGREWGLLHELMRAAPNVVSKAKLTDSLGRWDREVTANAIEIYVSRLRATLGAGDVEVRTVRGIGYRLAPSGAAP